MERETPTDRAAPRDPAIDPDGVATLLALFAFGTSLEQWLDRMETRR